MLLLYLGRDKEGTASMGKEERQWETIDERYGTEDTENLDTQNSKRSSCEGTYT